jgi:hypothetical protein
LELVISTVGVDHEDAVGGGVQGGGEQGEGVAQAELGHPPGRDVMGGDDEASDGRVVEEVDDGQLEGHRLARRRGAAAGGPR